jgi:protein-disulfide isomerase
MRRLISWLAAAAAAPAVAFALAQAAAPQMDKSRLEDFLRHLMLWGPQIQVTLSDPRPSGVAGLYEVEVTARYQQASVEEVFFVSADGKHVFRGSMFRADQAPYAADAAKIRTEGHPAMGAKNPKEAPLQLVVFSDFQCNFCREEARSLRENLPKAYPGQFRLVFRDLPIEQIHPWARAAAIAGRCAFRQSGEMFWQYHDWIFEKQAEIKPDNFRVRVMEWLKAAGGNEAAFAACLDSPEPAAEVASSVAEARQLRIQSTPTLFVNGRALTGNVPWPQLKAILDLELEFAKKAASAADCCSLTLPVPGK